MFTWLLFSWVLPAVHSQGPWTDFHAKYVKRRGWFVCVSPSFYVSLGSWVISLTVFGVSVTNLNEPPRALAASTIASLLGRCKKQQHGLKGLFWPGSRDPILKILGPPNNFWTKRAVRLKFGTDIQNGPSLHTDHKTTPKWAWPGSRDQFRKFGTPL